MKQIEAWNIEVPDGCPWQLIDLKFINFRVTMLPFSLYCVSLASGPQSFCFLVCDIEKVQAAELAAEVKLSTD